MIIIKLYSRIIGKKDNFYGFVIKWIKHSIYMNSIYNRIINDTNIINTMTNFKIATNNANTNSDIRTTCEPESLSKYYNTQEANLWIRS